jgi:hypothetical protein
MSKAREVTFSLGDSPISTLYFSIIFVMLSIYLMKIYGIFVAIVSSTLYCLTLDISFSETVYTIATNAIQAGMILLFSRFIAIENFTIKRTEANDELKILLLLTGVIYVIVSFVSKSVEIFIAIFIGIILLQYIFYGIINKKICTFMKFLVLICLIPGFVAGFLNSIYLNNIFLESGWQQRCFLWAGSNFILLSTIGYIFLCVISNKNSYSKNNRSENIIEIRLPTVLYYISIILWNILFLLMYINEWLIGNTIIYTFPWLIGNLFFISNFIFSLKDEINYNKNAFAWLEKRVVIAESNTQMVTTIIAFLIPLTIAILQNTNIISVIKYENIIVIFVLNISVAIATIGLVWVPKENIKFMSFLKTLKTVLHLFSVSLLLLNAVLIINSISIQ